MRRFPIYLSVVVLLTLAATGCDLFSDDSEKGTVTLTGRVLDQDNDPIANATITVLPLDEILGETGPEGDYVFDVEVDSTMDLEVVARKTGFTQASVSVPDARAGTVVNVPIIRLTQDQEISESSGYGANILLLSQETSSIGVKESGADEVATLVFQVTDSLGKPITIDRKALVSFTLGQAPGGGEFIFPEVAETNNNGEVEVNISSGTRAGVVQLVAQSTIQGETIRSLPVSIAIHGGLPDQRHFTLGPATFNFPGLRAFNLTNRISVLVGDKWSNPVRPGTSVSFSTDFGLVEGSTTTNAQGSGSVNLISGNPLPPNGVVNVTATTADENQAPVSGITPVLMTGGPVISVQPSVASLNTTYTLDVTDWNGNPLVQGTSISVKAEGNRVKAVGNVNVQMDETTFTDGGRDTDGDGFSNTENADGDNLDFEDVLTGFGVTRYTFAISEEASTDSTNTEPARVDAIVITVSGPNGRLEVVLGGGAPKAAADTRRTTIRTIGDKVVARLEE
ncbi:MAG: carboxypeptidase-like regulatory domain-containing protein [Rhodothermales bacterium]|nr:carboxypeptidase-like regulatory domain-containing protein [Rhodothermales bacterium]